MEFEKIVSKSNERIKTLVKLQDRRSREHFQKFIIEGLREVERALESKVKLLEIYFCPELFSKNESVSTVQRAYNLGLQITEVTRDVFEKISFREGPDGILAVGLPYVLDFDQIALTQKPLILVIEAIEKPGNLGALIRTAEAAGVEAILMSDPVVDLFNPQVIRASQGLVFKLPIIVSENDKVLDFLLQNNIQILATTPHVKEPYWSVDMQGPTAILLGSEKSGLSEFWLEKNAQNKKIVPITIPMLGSSDSLNVNAAATIVLFEAVRQRYNP